MNTVTEDLKARWILETEKLIDNKRRTVEQLIAEAEGHEQDIEAARALLQMLKTGHVNGKVPAEVLDAIVEDRVAKILEERVPPVETPAEDEEPTAETVAEATELIQPRKPRRPMVRLSEDDFMNCVRSLPGKDFTFAEVMAVTGMTDGGARGRLRKLAERGLLKVTKPAGPMVPGVGATPTRYKVEKGK